MTHDEIEEIATWVKSPTLPKLFFQIEEKLVASWKGAQKTDDREHCWRMIQCLHQIESELMTIAASQRVDQHNANRKNHSFNLPRPEPRAP